MSFAEHKADTIGIVSSFLCLIHCMVLPLLVFGGMLNEDFGTHAAWIDYLFIMLAITSVYFATRRSAMNHLKIGLWLCVSWFSLSILLHDVFDTALYSSMIASIMLVVLHGINFRQHQQHYHPKKATA